MIRRMSFVVIRWSYGQAEDNNYRKDNFCISIENLLLKGNEL